MSTDHTEKTPLQSKKFVGYVLAEATWKVVLGTLLVLGIREAQIDVFIGTIALAIVVVAGFIEAGYIVGQASLDKYVRIAKIAAQNGKAFSFQGMEVGKVQPQPPQEEEPDS